MQIFTLCSKYFNQCSSLIFDCIEIDDHYHTQAHMNKLTGKKDGNTEGDTTPADAIST